jgi:hypothetical protein
MTMMQDVPAAERSARMAAGPTEALILDFLEWLAAGPRNYSEVMEAWRTSCPRLTVWEDCVDLGYVVRRRGAQGAQVELTALGRQQLRRPA